MTPKTINITYRILTALYVLAMLGDAFGGITHQKEGVLNMQHLQYPIYMMTIMGVAKLLGALAILQTKFIAIKEWAFSGFTISFIGALWSRIYMGDGIGLVLPPVIMLLITVVYYFLWKKFLQLKAAN